MSDDATTTETPDTSGAGATVPEGYVPRADLDAVEAKRRGLQSENDRLAAQLKAAQTPKPASDTSGDDEWKRSVEEKLQSFDPTALADQFTARFNQQQAVLTARSAAKTEFPNAAKSVLEAEYDSAEALRAAVEASHTTESNRIAEIKAQARQEFAAEMKAKHGVTLDPAPQTTADGGNDKSTDDVPRNQSDLARMSTAAVLALPDDVYQKAAAVAE